MNYLLDSHTMLWSIIEPRKLSSKARKIIENPEHTILVSAVSVWEISLKYALGKLDLQGIIPNEILGLIEETGFEFISLTPEESASYCNLEASWHRDPFDRMLIWQAIQRSLILISTDKNVSKYQSIGLKVLW